MGQNGKSLVEDNIDNFVKYYIECTQVINLEPDRFLSLGSRNTINWHPDNFRISEIPKSQPILSIISKTTEHSFLSLQIGLENKLKAVNIFHSSVLINI